MVNDHTVTFGISDTALYLYQSLATTMHGCPIQIYLAVSTSTLYRMKNGPQLDPIHQQSYQESPVQTTGCMHEYQLQHRIRQQSIPGSIYDAEARTVYMGCALTYQLIHIKKTCTRNY